MPAACEQSVRRAACTGDGLWEGPFRGRERGRRWVACTRDLMLGGVYVRCRPGLRCGGVVGDLVPAVGDVQSCAHLVDVLRQTPSAEATTAAAAAPAITPPS